MSRLSEIFTRNKKCFIPFVTAGHPDLETTREIVLALAASGSHVIEIGIPFSDPIADGPIIQKSSFQALRNGYSFADYIDLIRQIRRETEVGLVFMTYMNPVLSYGLQKLDREGVEAGLDGVLISDLTPEEYSRMEPLEALDTIFLAAPTSSDQRLQKIREVSRGFCVLGGPHGRHGEAVRCGGFGSKDGEANSPLHPAPHCRGLWDYFGSGCEQGLEVCRRCSGGFGHCEFYRDPPIRGGFGPKSWRICQKRLDFSSLIG